MYFFFIEAEDVTFFNLVYNRFTTESVNENHELSIKNQDVKFFGNK